MSSPDTAQSVQGSSPPSKARRGRRRVGAALAGVLSVLLGVSAAVTAYVAAPVHAESSGSLGSAQISSKDPTAFNAYANAGETITANFARTSKPYSGSSSQTFQLTDPQNVVRWTCTLARPDLTGNCAVNQPVDVSGVWRLNYTTDSSADLDVYFYSWNVTVAQGATPILGRVYTGAYNAAQVPTISPPADLTFWVVTDAGYVYEMNLREYNGVYSAIRANSTGNVLAGTCTPTYESVEMRPPYNSSGCAAQRLFFAPPAADLPATAQAPSAPGQAPVTVKVKPPMLNAAALQINNMTFTSTSFAQHSGTFRYSITPYFTGPYLLQIDTNNNGSYDDPEDREISLGADGSGNYSYTFDGVNGTGAPIPVSQPMKARVFYSQIGETHLSFLDVEGAGGGIEIQRLDAADQPVDDVIYWNDTQLADDRANTTPIKDGTGGMHSAGGVHGWAYDDNSWGNNRSIDNWMFVPIQQGAGEIPIPALVPAVTVGKSSVPASGEVVQPGQVVQYTLTYENTGTAPGSVNSTDDLSNVLDDAELVAGPTVVGPGVSAALGADNKLRVTGSLDPAGTAEVTYSVRVKAKADRVNSDLLNVVTPDPGEGTCTPSASACETDHKIGDLVVTKSVNPPTGSTVKAGAPLTYTVTFTNQGTAAVPVSQVDDMADVLDDAEMKTQPSLDNVALTVSGPVNDQYTVSGSLPAGATAKMTYTVEVKPDGQRRNNTLANYVVPEGTPPPPTCEPTNATCTVNFVSDVVVSKSSNPQSGSSVVAGDQVTYTLTFENRGSGPGKVDSEDDLSEVLDDARLTAGPTVAGTGAAGVTATVGADRVLLVSGSLRAGESATVSYTVEVEPNGERNDSVLTNVLVPSEPSCLPGQCTSTLPVKSFTVKKSVDRTTVIPGGVLEYTITLTNTGQAAYTGTEASFTDDLTEVLDDASIEGPLPPGVSLTGNTLAWSGAIPVGTPVELKYRVKVNDPNTGDGTITNIVAPGTGIGGSCESTALCTTTTKVKAYTVQKAVSATTATPGQTLTYTVRVTNTGQVAYNGANLATFTDDLSDVLDNAKLVTPLGPGLSVTGNTLSWSGALTPAGTPGSTVDVVYQMKLDEPVTGDRMLVNSVQVPTGDGGDCLQAGACSTTTDVRQFRVDKSANQTEVKPGEEVTYTVRVTNTGTAPFTAAAPASFTDDLSQVFRHSQLKAGSVTGGAQLNGNVLSWSGALPVDGQAVIEYTVVLDQDVTENTRLVNVVVSDGGNCPSGSVDPACQTVIPQGSYRVDKAVSATTAFPGDLVKYTILVSNTSDVAFTADAPASFRDDLSRVLDDGTIEQVTGGATVTGNTLSWSGALPAAGQQGSTVEITYTVKVKPTAPVGEGAQDGVMLNRVVPTAPGGDCPAVCSTTTLVGSFTVEKTSHLDGDTTVAEPVVRPGDVLTYEVTVRNTGQVAFAGENPASFTDDLSGVFTGASLVPGSVTGGATVSGDTLSWSGPLDVSGEHTIAYQVRVNPASEPATALQNTVVPGDGGACARADGCSTTDDIQAYTVTKTVSSERAASGSTLTYTIAVANTGTVPYTQQKPASFTDDLSAVLKVATYNGDATGGATYSEPVLSWSGALGVGQTTTVTYSVTVNDGASGAAKNIVVTPDGSGANCPAGTDAEACQVTFEIDPSAPVVPAGPAGLAQTGQEISIVLGVGAAVLGAGIALLLIRRRKSTHKA